MAQGGWMGMVGGIVSAVGNRYDAYETARAYKSLARQRERQAQDALRIGQEKARLVRRVGRRILGDARADYASSGVVIGLGGSTDLVEQQLMLDTETDALNAIFESLQQDSALREEAHQLRRAATKTQVKATFDNISTVLGSMG